MLYNYSDTFIVSAPTCMNTDPDSLESIIMGNDAGANGCAVDFDMTADGITVLCGHGGYLLQDGSSVALSECSFEEARRVVPKIVTVGQVIELAKSCSAKLCIHLKNPACCAQIQLALHHADFAEMTYFTELTLDKAAALAARFPTLQFMADVLDVPEDPSALLRSAQAAGLFGLRLAPTVASSSLVEEAHHVGLMIGAMECHDEAMLQRLISMNVNFIETLRPDTAFALMPHDEADAALS